jgi:hypothetical protein
LYIGVVFLRHGLEGYLHEFRHLFAFDEFQRGQDTAAALAPPF